MDNLDGEEWRPVVGYEGWYDISSYGRVRRIKAGPGTVAQRMMKLTVRPKTRKGAYPRVVLSRGSRGESKEFRVHRLVAAAYLGPCPPRMVVNHIDNDPTNNRVENLEYVTHRENLLHALRLCPASSRPRQYREKSQAGLTDQHIVAIRALAPLFRYRRIAELFGITETYVAAIVNRHAWKHVA